MSDDLVKMLLGLVGIVFAGMVWMLKRRNGRPAGESAESVKAREDAVRRVTDKLEDVGKDITAELAKTRHDLRNELQSLTLRITEAIADEFDHRAIKRK